MRAQLADVRAHLGEIRVLERRAHVVRQTRDIEIVLDKYEQGFLAVVELQGRRGSHQSGLAGLLEEKARPSARPSNAPARAGCGSICWSW
ncbi:hypothetical protein [Massilia glaciei]|uniref:Uncharacterized protein n=1 Tax=Massilia glaciei TaxID=1524097 RepID=A0A2U2HFX3_9BURK|nr:hypothetical protein [Massilia glaciei]PWF43618.1 hypothetical protein C7C56_021015 [Massilia glaciei]